MKTIGLICSNNVSGMNPMLARTLRERGGDQVLVSDELSSPSLTESLKNQRIRYDKFRKRGDQESFQEYVQSFLQACGDNVIFMPSRSRGYLRASAPWAALRRAEGMGKQVDILYK